MYHCCSEIQYCCQDVYSHVVIDYDLFIMVFQQALLPFTGTTAIKLIALVVAPLSCTLNEFSLDLKAAVAQFGFVSLVDS